MTVTWNPDDPQLHQPTYPPPPGSPAYGQTPQGGWGGGPMPPPDPRSVSGAPGRASMSARFGALIIDTVLLGVVGFILGFALGGYRFHTTRVCDSAGVCTKQFHVSGGLTVNLITALLGLVYFSYLVGVRTQTLGHRVAGVRVVDLATGSPIGLGRGFLRWLVLGVTGALCTLGYWSPFFDSNRRGWHDKASRAIAVSVH